MKMHNVLNPKFIILISLIFSILVSKYNLDNYDKYFERDEIYQHHIMIKTDALRYLSHGAEIKKELEDGKNFFETGRVYFTKYLPSRLAAAYYYFLDIDLFNNFEEKNINLEIHFPYLIIQCAIYYFLLFCLYLVISQNIPKKICFFITVFLGLEPTIFQYHGTFWSESIFFSLQLLVLIFVMRNKTNSLNFFWIGLSLGLLSIQRSPAFFYIIPIIIYFLIILEKNTYPKILFIIVGYTVILSFVGYHNYVRAGVFYIMPNETRSNINLYLIPSIISDEAEIQETKLALEWIKQNKIKIDVKVTNKEIRNYQPHEFCELPLIKNEKEKVEFCNYVKSRTIKLLLDNPYISLKHILYNSFHILLLNPFHIYSDHHFVSGEVYYRSSTHKKLIPLRIVYTSIIFIISLFGFIKLLRNKNKDLLILIVLSSVYFFTTISWHGNTRYFAPVLIYLSVFFGNGSVLIIDFLNKKFFR